MGEVEWEKWSGRSGVGAVGSGEPDREQWGVRPVGSGSDRQWERWAVGAMGSGKPEWENWGVGAVV